MDNRKKEVINALSDCYGIVTDACRKSDVPRSTFYKWCSEDPEFKAAVDDIQEEAIDFVEGQLLKKITGVKTFGYEDGKTGKMVIYDQPPSDTAIIFYLKTKGKKRGYIEKTEQDIKHSGGVTMIWQDAEYGQDYNKENEGLKSEPGCLPIEEIQGHS